MARADGPERYCRGERNQEALNKLRKSPVKKALDKHIKASHSTIRISNTPGYILSPRTPLYAQQLYHLLVPDPRLCSYTHSQLSLPLFRLQLQPLNRILQPFLLRPHLLQPQHLPLIRRISFFPCTPPRQRRRSASSSIIPTRGQPPFE